MNKEKEKLYTPNQIGIATFIGGPLIAGYLIGHNFKVFGKDKTAKKSNLLAILGTLLLILLFVVLPYIVPYDIPNISIAIVPLVIAVAIVETYQRKKIDEYIKSGYNAHSSWGVFGKSLLSLVITIIVNLVIYALFTAIVVKYNYAGYLNNYCRTTYGKFPIKDTQLYVPEDASCFVTEKLEGKGYTLEQVDHVLTVEFEYQKSIGIVSDSKETAAGSQPLYDPLPYIRDHQTMGLTDDQINEILLIEEEYLKLIGVMKL